MLRVREKIQFDRKGGEMKLTIWFGLWSVSLFSLGFWLAIRMTVKETNRRIRLLIDWIKFLQKSKGKISDLPTEVSK